MSQKTSRKKFGPTRNLPNWSASARASRSFFHSSCSCLTTASCCLFRAAADFRSQDQRRQRHHHRLADCRPDRHLGWLLTGVYVNRANGEFDSITEEVLKEARK
jgi:hypothetical protein